MPGSESNSNLMKLKLRLLQNKERKNKLAIEVRDAD